MDKLRQPAIQYHVVHSSTHYTVNPPTVWPFNMIHRVLVDRSVSHLQYDIMCWMHLHNTQWVSSVHSCSTYTTPAVACFWLVGQLAENGRKEGGLLRVHLVYFGIQQAVSAYRLLALAPIAKAKQLTVDDRSPLTSVRALFGLVTSYARGLLGVRKINFAVPETFPRMTPFILFLDSLWYFLV